MSWNVNSIRSRVHQVGAWLDRHGPDVVALQETRCHDRDFPFAAFTSRGYEVSHYGVDHRNGVALASRVGLADVVAGLPGVVGPPMDEPRVLGATCDGVRVASLYVPNGRSLDNPHYQFKLDWLDRVREYTITSLAAGVPLLLLGDFNVAPTDLDIYDPSRWRGKTHASPPERAAITALIDLGLVDLVRHVRPEAGVYTWWNYRPQMLATNRGLRIDLALGSAAVAARLVDAWIDTEVRAELKPSDHAPVVVDLLD